MDSGKCRHEHLIVHRAENGYDFYAQCSECGMRAEKTGRSPSEARERFDRSKGARPGQKLAGAALARSQGRQPAAEAV